MASLKRSKRKNSLGKQYPKDYFGYEKWWLQPKLHKAQAAIEKYASLRTQAAPYTDRFYEQLYRGERLLSIVKA